MLCRTWRRQCNHLHFFLSGYAVIFIHEGKRNTSFGTERGLLLFVCTHNINKTLCLHKIKKTNMISAVSSRTGALHKDQPKLSEYMPHRHNTYIYIESCKWLLNEIKQIKNKNSFIKIISKDVLVSKSASNEEMASQDRQPHPPCDTDSEKTSLLVNS